MNQGKETVAERILTVSEETLVNNTAVWDAQFASELENHCHQISVGVKEKCEKLVSIIAENVLLGDRTRGITENVRFDDGGNKRLDVQEIDQGEQELCKGPCTMPLHIDISMPTAAVGANAPTRATSEFVISDRTRLSVDQASEPVHTSSCASVMSNIAKSLDWVHTQIDQVMDEFDGHSQPASGCAQFLACFFPCFVKPISVRDSGDRMHHVVSTTVREALGETVKSQMFDIMVGWLILLNSMVMVVEFQYYGYEAQISLGIIDDDGSWPNAKSWFSLLEHVFNVLFLVEFGARCYVYRWHIWNDRFNIFDGTCLLLSSIHLYVLSLFTNVEIGGNVTLFRLLRLARFNKATRVMSVFSELRVLVTTCLSSLRALAWSMILLFIIMILAGLLLCGLVKDYIKDPSKRLESRKWVFKHYGTSTRSIYTLFEVTMAGCWPTYFRPLIHDVSGFFAVFAIIYITFVVFAILRIITAIFLKETLHVAAGDASMMENEQIKAKRRYVRNLHRVFEAIDVSGDGKLDVTEFKLVAAHPKVKSYLAHLDLEVHDVDALFDLLDDGDGALSYHEFLSGVMRLKGVAKSIDTVGIMHTTEKILRGVNGLQMQLKQFPRLQADFEMGVL